jgi:hypothetical protein
MALVQIRGLSVELDEEDVAKVLARNWSIHWAPDPYLSTSDGVRGKRLFIHRFILGLHRGDGKIVDHINRKTLDNRKTNLRICTNAQNHWNQKKPSSNTTGHKGIWFNPKRNHWRATIKANKREIYLGVFKTKEEAIFAYVNGAHFYHGEFARPE